MRIYEKNYITFDEFKEDALFYRFWSHLDTPENGIDFMHTIAQIFVLRKFESPLIEVKPGGAIDKDERIITINIYDRGLNDYREIKVAYDLLPDVSGVCQELSEYVVEYNDEVSDINFSDEISDLDLAKLTPDNSLEFLFADDLKNADEKAREHAAGLKMRESILKKVDGYSKFSIISFGIVS